VRRDVHDDGDRGGQVGRQAGGDGLQRVDTSGRRSDDDGDAFGTCSSTSECARARLGETKAFEERRN
jgi:hypothetical protein